MNQIKNDMPLVTQESWGYAWIPHIMRFIDWQILIETATNSLKPFTTGTCVFALGSFFKLNAYTWKHKTIFAVASMYLKNWQKSTKQNQVSHSDFIHP